MLDSMLSLLIFAGCVWFLVNVGAKMQGSVKKTNRKLKKGIRGVVKAMTEDE